MAEPAERPRSRWLAPTAVFAALAVLVVAQILRTPHDETLEDRPSLDPRSSLPSGSRGFGETLDRLGWSVTRRTTPMREPLDSAALYVVLDGIEPVSAAETHELLEAVRRGAALLVTPGRDSPLADSLGVRASATTFGMPPAGPGGLDARPADDDAKKGDQQRDSSEWIGTIDPAIPALAASVDSGTLEELARAAREIGYVRAHLEPLDSADEDRAPFPRDTASFITGRRRDAMAPVVMGMTVGRGRVVAVADPYLFTNRMVRDGDAALVLVRAVEWLGRGRHSSVVLDLYHHARTASVGPGPVRRAMLETPLGRAALQLLFAATLVVLALGARPLAPRSRMRVERRSPFEHVGALARAYEQVRATRIASRRLLHGLRRRHPIGRDGDEEAYLAALGARYPDVVPELDTVRKALRRPVAPAEFLEVGQAIETIERKIES
jgi:hypothetical protein